MSERIINSRRCLTPVGQRRELLWDFFADWFTEVNWNPVKNLLAINLVGDGFPVTRKSQARMGGTGNPSPMDG